MADVKIVMIAHGRGDVFVDGHRIEGVRRIGFSAAVGKEANMLTLELIPKRVEIQGPAELAEAPSVEVTALEDAEPRRVPVAPPPPRDVRGRQR
ncbi:MAG TPA: hypothetical protein VIG97_03480 [Luteimonas sp.]